MTSLVLLGKKDFFIFFFYQKRIGKGVATADQLLLQKTKLNKIIFEEKNNIFCHKVKKILK